jgi:hypothetical protein
MQFGKFRMLNLTINYHYGQIPDGMTEALHTAYPLARDRHTYSYSSITSTTLRWLCLQNAGSAEASYIHLAAKE